MGNKPLETAGVECCSTQEGRSKQDQSRAGLGLGGTNQKKTTFEKDYFCAELWICHTTETLPLISTACEWNTLPLN